MRANKHKLFALLWLASLVALPVTAQNPVLIRMDENAYVGFGKNRGAHLDVRVENPSDLLDVIRVYTGRFDGKFSYKAQDITQLNNKRAIVPYLALSPGFKRLYLKTLWPEDKVVKGQLVHKVIYSNETLWAISQMYTGFGNNYRKIKAVSGIRGNSLRKGMTLKIPYELLMDLLKEKLDPDLPALKEPEPATTVTEVREDIRFEAVNAPPIPEPVPLEEETRPKVKETATDKESATPEQVHGKPANQGEETTTSNPPEDKKPGSLLSKKLKELEKDRAELRYGADAKGRYAEYRLKKGEAIYSSVVVRFCGLVRAPDVNRIAEEIIDRNNIRDVTDMAIGHAIRIPYTYLEPEFKAGDDPEFQQFIANLEEVGQLATAVESADLDGVYLVLDAGHGGRDPGADRNRVWEDDFVYDIVCRIKKRLESESAATVIPTIMDPSVEYKVQDVTLFRRDEDEHLITTPKYHLKDRRVNVDGVNLRWMISNHHYEKLLAKGVKPENVIFASFHADALHRSIRGTMVYIPDALHYPKDVTPPARLTRFREAKGNHFSLDRRRMQAAQARSMAFADNYVEQSRALGIRVHQQKPIRSLIYRNPTRPFVPAVLRFNRVPTRVLIEICNLNNPNDQNLLKRPDFRQKVADAFVETVYRTYGTKVQAASLGPSSENLRGGE